MPRFLFVACLLLAASAASAADPAAVRRYGPAYRYPQAGWTVLHIEGEPFDRGYQHGRLLASDIATYVKILAHRQSAKAPEDGWRLTRTLVGAAFLRKFDQEQLEEMRGIADGAAAAGATFDGRPIDLVDIATVNVQVEYDSIDAALDAQPTGLEGVRFPRPAAPKAGPVVAPDHCSAFVAAGPATRAGKLVIGHITMSGLSNALDTNVWIDVKPTKGHRVVMQGFPGAIWSGQDYYLNSAGIVLTETTIRQTRFNPDGTPMASRARRAMQYGATIDEVVKHLTDNRNGLYTNDWLIGDANTNEIASLELGTTTYKLRRSSKNEWLLPGTEGFYWGCNNTKDLGVRLDTVPSLADRPFNLTWRPSDRDKSWLRLYEQHRGKVDAEFGKLAFRTAPLAAHPSLDAKVTTADMAKRLETHAVFGPPYGRVWHPTHEERNEHPEIRPLVPNEWVVLTPAAPAAGGQIAAADLSDRVTGSLGGWADDPHTAPAWHGTLVPKSDADLWLTAGFAEYERVVALVNTLTEKGGGKLSAEDKKRIELALFRYQSDYAAAVAARPAWRTESGTPGVSPLEKELDRDRWHSEQVARGVLILHDLRELLGAAVFAKQMDEFGRVNAGKSVTVEEFTTAVGNATRRGVEKFVATWMGPATEKRAVSAAAWARDPELLVIVYGTTDDAATNKAAAETLRDALRDRWENVAVPVLADTAADADLKGKHVLLIGRPAANKLAERFAAAFPVTFGPQSATVNGTVYAHPRTAVVTAGISPADPRYSVAVVAGLSAEATYHAVTQLGGRGRMLAAEVLVYPAGGAMTPVMIRKPEKMPAAE
ncbi:MAG: C45 family autoproteolytic acyltransferase/hydrolase [Gemmataceae bacterium]